MKRLAAPVTAGSYTLAIVLATLGALSLAQAAVAAPVSSSGFMHISTDR